VLKRENKPDMVVSTYYPSIGEAEAGRLRVQGQPRLYSEAISKSKKKKGRGGGN
jgi:hypothetical protein